jgi:hypothetical protein
VLTGTQEISDCAFGGLRRTQHLIHRRLIPFFKLGAIVHARRSTLRAYIEWLEREAAGK